MPASPGPHGSAWFPASGFRVYENSESSHHPHHLISSFLHHYHHPTPCSLLVGLRGTTIPKKDTPIDRDTHTHHPQVCKGASRGSRLRGERRTRQKSHQHIRFLKLTNAQNPEKFCFNKLTCRHTFIVVYVSGCVFPLPHHMPMIS